MDKGKSSPTPEEHHPQAVIEIRAMLEACGIPEITEKADCFLEVVEQYPGEAIGFVGSTLSLMRANPDWVVMSNPFNYPPSSLLYMLFTTVHFRGKKVLEASDPSSEREMSEFLSSLQACPGYPYDEAQDSNFFKFARVRHPGVDIVGKTMKKIAYWVEHPGSLKGRRPPREQLADWFEDDFMNKKGRR